MVQNINKVFIQYINLLLKWINSGNEGYNYADLSKVLNYPLGISNFPYPKLPRFTLVLQKKGFHFGFHGSSDSICHYMDMEL